ncbi:hypothetical protein PIB30_114301, partial [Stylosanthes scabra]|nr:hypothetical protein [Stylosanthes scabra]
SAEQRATPRRLTLHAQAPRTSHSTAATIHPRLGVLTSTPSHPCIQALRQPTRAQRLGTRHQRLSVGSNLQLSEASS